MMSNKSKNKEPFAMAKGTIRYCVAPAWSRQITGKPRETAAFTQKACRKQASLLGCVQIQKARLPSPVLFFALFSAALSHLAASHGN
ncbi:hypothetical protein [uncultured Oxalicibacterium sp.]|uniref:hypothetical protein n=1 Tax=uncultured Oxalicibacterium sp. TaxID=1168540 RepID=UPI0025CCE85F|nr:hypothetical protein [uncultured Oxalicibacterium sp.]